MATQQNIMRMKIDSIDNSSRHILVQDCVLLVTRPRRTLRIHAGRGCRRAYLVQRNSSLAVTSERQATDARLVHSRIGVAGFCSRHGVACAKRESESRL